VSEESVSVVRRAAVVLLAASGIALAPTPQGADAGRLEERSRSVKLKQNEQVRFVTLGCAGDEWAISGGFDAPVKGSNSFAVPFMSRRTGARSWTVGAMARIAQGIRSVNLRAYVYCGPGRKPRAVAKARRLREGGKASGVTARCPDRFAAISGGFHMDPPDTVAGFVTASQRNGNGWVSEGVTARPSAPIMTSYVYCRRRPPLDARFGFVSFDELFQRRAATTPSCKGTLLSGGFAQSQAALFGGVHGRNRAVAVNRSHRARNGWRAGGLSFAAGRPMTFQADAFCS
jgi:hypothetical protein